MADGFLSGLTRRAYDARDTAEEYGRDAGRRLREGSGDARGELRRLWSQMEDLIERNVGSSPREVARTAGDYARDYARMAGTSPTTSPARSAPPRGTGRWLPSASPSRRP